MVKDPCFKIEFMDFSQRRREGFRQRPEFDNKRVLIADKKTIKIIAYYDVDVSQLDLRTKVTIFQRAKPLGQKAQ
jgi:hypothetical protein